MSCRCAQFCTSPLTIQARRVGARSSETRSKVQSLELMFAWERAGAGNYYISNEFSNCVEYDFNT